MKQVAIILTITALALVVQTLVLRAQAPDTLGAVLPDTLVRMLDPMDPTAAAIADSSALPPPPTSADEDTSVYNSTILDLLRVRDVRRGAFAWRIDRRTFSYEEVLPFDTLLLQPHMNMAHQKELTPYTSTGNLGGPLQSTDFLARPRYGSFLFMRSFEPYQKGGFGRSHMHVRSPHTLLTYSMGGRSSQADLTLGVQHTQNVNPHLNFGLDYDYYNTKGMYAHQLTRDNAFSGFVSYYKNRLLGQLTVSTTTIKNQYNGGVQDEFYIRDTVLDARLVPMNLTGASAEIRHHGFSLMGGFHFVEKRTRLKSDSGADSLVLVKPIITGRVLLEHERYRYLYTDGEGDAAFYQHSYIHPSASHDTASMRLWNAVALVEVSQIASYPGIPGLRAWVGNTSGRYAYFDVSQYLYKSADKRLSANYLGVGVYSNSDYLTYSGSAQLYLNGFRAGDKELFGQMTVSPWRSTELPYVRARIEILDCEPDVFMQHYASNHFKWDNDFRKQQTFSVAGEFGAERWNTWVGYRLAHIANYLHFDSLARPAQAGDGVTITSAYIRNHLRLGPVCLINRLQWQKNSNERVLSLPELALYSSLFVQHDLVKGVLTAQLGGSVQLTSAYYADAYMPATAQFYNQREGRVGSYPFLDVFLNMKWKSALIFLKYEHLNEGLLGENNYFVAYRHPARRKGFKFGFSWIFYD
ncbi:MAG: hypothetical protein IJU72_04330 [Bacteroidales bacterium]|nr:hypothetical protein [Bacteroidales bacterium]